MTKLDMQINIPQKELLLALGRTGAITSENAEYKLGVNRQRVNFLIEAEMISKSKVYYPKKGLITYYCLEKKGRQYLQSKCGYGFLYRFSHKQIKHDLKLSSYYLNLDDEIRQTWITESEILNVLLPNSTAQNSKVGAIDAIIKREGQLYGIEAVTKNYTIKDIQEKEKIAQRLNCCSLILI